MTKPQCATKERPAAKYIFVNRFFHPDISATSQILSDLAFHLARQGHAVHVVCSRQMYQDSKADLPKFACIQGVTVHRIWSTQFGRNNLLGRMVDSGTFLIFAGLRLITLPAKRDLVISKTDPPMLGFVAFLASKVRRFRLAHWMQDLFPEITEAVMHTRRLHALLTPFWSFVRILRNFSLRHSHATAVIGPSMRGLLRQIGLPAHRLYLLPNWSPIAHISPVPRSANPLIAQWGLQDKFIVMYSGNMGRAHDFATILDTAQQLLPYQTFAILMVGNGAAKPALQSAAAQRHLTNIHFLPYQPDELVPFSLSAADVHLVSMLPSMCGLVYPSKIYGILAAGRPIAFIGPPHSDAFEMVSSNQLGVALVPGDISTLTSYLHSLQRDPELLQTQQRSCRQYFDAHLSRDESLKRWRNSLAMMCN